MPTLLTMPQIAGRALANLYNASVLIGLVSRDYDASFAGQQGDTVNVRVPVVFQSTRFNRGTGIQLQNPAEDKFPIVLDEIADVSFPVTSEQMTLSIDNFDEQLLMPAMEAIVQQVEGDLAEKLVDAASQSANPGGSDYVAKQKGGGIVSGTDADVLIDARAILGRNNMPTLNRAAIFSPEGTAKLLKDPAMHEADKRGDTDGLIEAAIGRKFGFDNYESNRLGYGPNDAGQADGVAFHRSAIALATRTLEKPMGTVGQQSAIVNYKGLGLRVVYGYDLTYKQTVVSVDFLYGTRVVRPQGSVEINLGLGS